MTWSGELLNRKLRFVRAHSTPAKTTLTSFKLGKPPIWLKQGNSPLSPTVSPSPFCGRTEPTHRGMAVLKHKALRI